MAAPIDMFWYMLSFLARVLCAAGYTAQQLCFYSSHVTVPSSYVDEAASNHRIVRIDQTSRFIFELAVSGHAYRRKSAVTRRTARDDRE